MAKKSPVASASPVTSKTLANVSFGDTKAAPEEFPSQEGPESKATPNADPPAPAGRSGVELRRIRAKPTVVNDGNGDSSPFDFSDPSDDEPALTSADADSDANDSDDAVTDETADRAREFGLSEDEIADFASDDALSVYLDRIEARAGRVRQPDPKPDRGDRGGDDPPKPEPEPEFKLDLGEEFESMMDEKARNAFKGLADFTNQTRGDVKKIKQDLAQVINYLREREQRAEHDGRVQAMDAVVAEIGDTRLGSSSTSKLGAKSPEMRARKKLFDAALTLRAGYLARKVTPPSDEELFRRAFRVEFGEAKKVKKSTPVVRPTGRVMAQSGATPEARAIATVRQHLKRARGE